MKRLILVVIIIVIAILSVFLSSPSSNLEKAYNKLYETNTLVFNIHYDLNTTWDYYLTDESFNRTELENKISLTNEDMINDTCNLIYTKKIDVILDCITLSHDKNYNQINTNLLEAKKIIDNSAKDKNYQDILALYNLISESTNLTKYHGNDYKSYQEKYTSLNNKIKKIEDKYNNIYSVKTSTSM